jgi:hypothetical protein
MLKLIVIFVAGLVIGAVWGWGAGIMSVGLEYKRRKCQPARASECRAQH